MIDLILNEFGIANYHLLKNKEGKFLLTNEANSDFWIILSDYDIAVDKQQELFEFYRQEMKEYSTAEKNTSILILKCISHFDEEIKAWAVETENDKYYFKKYVLLYTQKAWDSLNNEIITFNSYMYKKPLKYVEKNTTIRTIITFKVPKIYPKEYTVTVALSEGTQLNHIQQHWIHTATIINIISCDFIDGCMYSLYPHEIEYKYE